MPKSTLNFSKIESFLKTKIFPDLARGRHSDQPHTRLVVKYVKQIIKNVSGINIDPVPLIIAAYAHDWGYTDMFDPDRPLTLKDIGNQKDLHMQVGARKLSELLTHPQFDDLTVAQKNRAVHLVAVHDKLEVLHDWDEIILMEADTLSGLEPDIMGVFSDSESEHRYLSKNRRLRFPLFLNRYSITEYERLFQKRQNKSHDRR